MIRVRVFDALSLILSTSCYHGFGDTFIDLERLVFSLVLCYKFMF
jgi:hypothetical protein